MLRTISAIALSAGLLNIAFPQVEWWPLAWVALVPLLLILDGKSFRICFWAAYCAGLLFFALTLGWFIHVTVPGAAVLIAYLSLFFGAFGAAVHFSQRLGLIQRLVFLPCVWVLLEYARAHLLSGFGWVLLGHSQAKNLAMIQIADLTGVYGVSFLVMLVNVFIAMSVRIKPGQKALWRKAHIAVIVVLVLAASYGTRLLKQAPAWPSVRVGVVQPNIAQELKWDPSLQPWIVQKTIRLSQDLQAQAPQLVVWPETSLPGIIGEEQELFGAIALQAKGSQTPILMGAVTAEEGKYYNSAFLIDAQGKTAGRYDKIHLVPFGEYLPLRPLLGWINRFVPLEDFTEGKDYALLSADGVPPFGVLICFEDTVSEVRRNFVRAGAQFLVNMTNDAWFKDTKAPFLHAQAATFGSIEHRRSLVRSANTGFSGFIDPLGRHIGEVRDAAGKFTFVAGSAMAAVPACGVMTFYTKYGDIFTLACLLAILWVLSGLSRRGKNAA